MYLLYSRIILSTLCALFHLLCLQILGGGTVTSLHFTNFPLAIFPNYTNEEQGAKKLSCKR